MKKESTPKHFGHFGDFLCFKKGFWREGGNQWTYKKQLPREWDIVLRGVRLKISLTDFGHLGVFPEHSSLWDWMRGGKSKHYSFALNYF